MKPFMFVPSGSAVSSTWKDVTLKPARLLRPEILLSSALDF